MWDDRYGEEGYAYGKGPNDFIRDQAHAFTPGARILCLASGEGRNAVYLATRGYRVTAVDLSVVGLEKTRLLASENGVEVHTIHADLASFDLGEAIWDGVTSVFAHVPPAVRSALHARVVRGLKPGGILLLEAYTPAHLDLPGRGGPPPHATQVFMTAEGLEQELAGLSFDLIRETQRTLLEGRYHEGLSGVVQVVARKPMQ
jgi:SAM-dependent methyltransferase